VKAPVKYSILTAGLLVAGAVRGTWENRLDAEFHAAGLLRANVGANTRDRIGQTSSAVALGGLRTLVATFLNLRAFTFFTEQRWGDVNDTFETIVDLAPDTGDYWETGSWHSAYNASYYYRYDANLPPLRAREEWRQAIFWGKAFLERGIRNNPGDWRLGNALGLLLSDEKKIVDYRGAAEAYQKAADTGKAMPFVTRFVVYCLARVPGQEAVALEKARQLYTIPSNRTSTLLCVLFSLEEKATPSSNPEAHALALFGNPKAAYQALSLYWQSRENFPLDGVPAALQGLERRLGIPADKSVLSGKESGKPGAPDWLKNPSLIETESTPQAAPPPLIGAPTPRPSR